MNLCKYNCGRKAIHQFKDGTWCCSKNQASCPEIKKKLGVFGDKNPSKRVEVRKGHRERMLGPKNPMKNLETARKQAETMKGKPSSRKGKKSPAISGDKNPAKRPEVRKKIRESKLGDKNPNYKKHPSSITIEKISKGMKKRWAGDPGFRIKCLRFQKPTKPENFLSNLLDLLYPEKYRYVGNYSLWIDGKNPDWVSKDKKIIEFFGRYWHKDGDEKEREVHFERNGYKTLVIWEEELKDVEKLKERIVEFSNV